LADGPDKRMTPTPPSPGGVAIAQIKSVSVAAILLGMSV